MIQVAHILPTTYLKVFETYGSKVHLALAHRILADEQYRAFYKRRKEEGDYIILDNSAFEFGASISDDKLDQAVEMLMPNELVLPDVLKNSSETFSGAVRFLDKYSKSQRYSNVAFLAVPQGSDMEDYIRSYIDLSTLPQIESVGIGAIYSSLFADTADNNFNGRQLLISELLERAALSNKPHHLLGLGNSGHLELHHLRRYDFIRSCDSSAAYVHAASRQKIVEGEPYTKETTKIDFDAEFAENMVDDIRSNISTINEAAGVR